MSVRVRLLSTVSVEVDGEPVDLPAGRTVELLAWLAAHPGRHPRSTLAPVFWPDVADATARASLRTAIWTLRRSLGPGGQGVLALDRQAVGLEGAGLWVDLRERDEWSTDQVMEADADDLLPGIESEWADEVRAEYHAARKAALGALHEQAEADDDAETAVRVARRLAEIEPFSEEYHRLLLRTLVASGDRAAAVHAHEQFRQRLWADLGVRPSRATQDLARQLSSGDESPPARLPNRLARHEGELMVGRSGGLDRLGDVWRACRGGQGTHVVLLTGEAGIGKTRLLAAFAADVNRQGGRVLFGAASEDELVPGEPFLEIIGENHSLAPSQLIDVTLTVLDAATAEGPVALALDDFHWADSVSFAVLRRIVRAGPEGLAVVLAYRPEERADARLATLRADVGRDAHVVRLPLEPLSLDQTASLLADLGAGGVLDDRSERIHADARGNPFFIRELGRYVVDHPDTSRDAAPVPDTVRDLVAAKLDSLSPAGNETVSAAAVLGARAELAVLRHVVATCEVLDAIEEAVDAGLMEEEGVGVHGFRHALVRNAVYECLSRSRQADLHRRAADALRAVHGDREGLHLCDIAEHRCAGSPPDSAVAAVAEAVRAGRWAIDHHAYDRAVVLLTKALQVCDPSSRQELAVLRASAYQRLTHDVIDPTPA